MITFPGSNAWTYHEVSIPVSVLGATFTLSFTANTPVSIDDILLYPDAAEAVTATYDTSGHYKIAATNTNGVSAYYTNDVWGRVLLQFDQDKNIVLNKSYFTTADVQSISSAVIGYSPTSNITNTTAISFSGIIGGNSCTVAGLVYHWNFGDGSSYTGPGNPPAHTYTTAGNYPVTLTITSPFFPTQTATPVNIPVSQATATVTYHASGIEEASILNITFTNLGGGPNYYFTPGTLPGNVVPGNYNITIAASGNYYSSPKGYTNIIFTDNGTKESCFTYSSSNSYVVSSYSVVANHTLDFSMYNNSSCP